MLVLGMPGCVVQTVAGVTFDGKPFRWTCIQVINKERFLFQLASANTGNGCIGLPITGQFLGFGLPGQPSDSFWVKLDKYEVQPWNAPSALLIAEGETSQGYYLKERIEPKYDSALTNSLDIQFEITALQDLSQLPVLGFTYFGQHLDSNTFDAEDGKEGLVRGKMGGKLLAVLDDVKWVRWCSLKRTVYLSVPSELKMSLTSSRDLGPAFGGLRIVSRDRQGLKKGERMTLRFQCEFQPMRPGLPDEKEKIRYVTEPVTKRDILSSQPLHFEPEGTKYPIWDMGQTAAVVAVPGHGMTHAQSLKYKILQGDLRQEIRSETLSLKDGVAQISFELKEPGIYRIEGELWDEGSKVLGKAFFEAISVGELAQRPIKGDTWNEGMDLELVDKIECGNSEDKHLFYSDDGLSKIMESPLGAYRVTPRVRDSWMSWKFTLKHPYVPHIIEIDYPDDAARTMGIDVIEGNKAMNDFGEIRLGGGVWTGYPYPLTHKIRTLRYVYFPRFDWATVTIINYNKDRFDYLREGAAVKEIRVWEVKNDLPAMTVNATAGEDRYFGRGSENLPTVAKLYLNSRNVSATYPWPPNIYEAWYNVACNMVKDLRFRGENTFSLGIYQYWVVMYPRDANDFSVYPAYFDPIRLLARIFEKNNLNLFLAVEFASTYRLQAKDVYTDEDVADGAQTLVQVSREGKQEDTGLWMGKGFNPFHPEVMVEYTRTLEEIARQYRDLPAIEGIDWYCGNPYAPCFFINDSLHYRPYYQEPLAYGYDDLTVSLFEKETGIKLPVDDKARDRFSQRYDWLVKNKKKEWMNWRSKKIAETLKTLTRKVEDITSNRWQTVARKWEIPSRKRLENMEPGETVDDLFLELASYPPFYKEVPGLTTVGNIPDLGKRDVDRAAGRSREQIDKVRNFAFMLYPTLCRLADNGRATATDWANCGSMVQEWNFRPRGKWVWSESWPCDFIAPAGEYAREGCAQYLAGLTPGFMSWWLADTILPDINWDEMRVFARAYRAIPGNWYTSCPGSSNECVARQGQGADAGYFYLVNRTWERLKVTVNGVKGKEIKDRVTGENLKVRQGQVEAEVEPYLLRVFECSPKSKIAIDTVTKMTETRVQNIMDILSEEKELAARHHLDTNAFDCALGVYEKTIRSGKSQWEAERMAQATPGLSCARAAVRGLQEGGRPWLILGPFDDDYPEFRSGYEKAFIKEGEEPDLLKEYQGLAGETIVWQKAIDRFDSMDFDEYFSPHEHVVGYAAAWLECPEKRKVKVLFGSDDGAKVWVNGKLAHKTFKTRSAVPGADTFTIDLEPGKNLVMIKVDDVVGGWKFIFQPVNEQGELMKDIKFSAPDVNKK